MAAYTAGDLRAGQFLAESSYGVILTSALAWFGETIQAANLNNDQQVFEILPGDRSFQEVTSGPYQKGFRWRGYSRAATEWTDFFMLYGAGAVDALTAHLGSFTAQIDVYDGTTHAYHTFNGCKINRMTVEATGPGQPLIFEIEVFAQYHEITATKSITTIQTVTVGADGAAPAGAIVTWNGNSQVNLGGGGLANWYPESWKWSILNKLEREPGIRTGGDSNAYPVAIALHEGERDILFEATLISQNQTYNNAKKLNTLVTQVTLPIDDETVTLNNGYFTRDDYASYEQKPSRETVKIMFKSCAIP